MKTTFFSLAAAATIAGGSLCEVPVAVAQGNLNPSGPPGPTMKTLQQLWDKMGGLEAQCTNLQNQVQALEAQNSTLTTYLLGMAEKQGLRLDWVITTVDGYSPEDLGGGASIALDTNSCPAISYYDETNGDLKYAHFDGTSWYKTIVDTGGTSATGPGTSLAFNPVTGYPAISYYDDTDKNLRYAVKDEGGWTASTVASSGDVGFYSSLAFRGSGAPVIAFYDRTNQRLRLAWWRPDVLGAWEFHTVDTGGNLGSGCSLARNPYSNEIWISYTSQGLSGTSGALHIARMTFKGLDLYPAELSVIDPGMGPYGYYTSLAFSPNRRPGVAYRRHSTSSLNYAEYDGANWHVSVVDDKDLPGAYCSLAFTPAGRPAVSYVTQTSGHLRYAEFDGASWRVMTIGGTTPFASNSSLVILPNGKPGISFHSQDNMLRYAELRSYRLVPAL